MREGFAHNSIQLIVSFLFISSHLRLCNNPLVKSKLIYEPLHFMKMRRGNFSLHYYIKSLIEKKGRGVHNCSVWRKKPQVNHDEYRQ